MRRILIALLLLGVLGAVGWLVVPPLVQAPARPARSAIPVRSAAPKDAGRPALREVAPAALAGEPFTVELMDPPATTYAATAPEDAGLADAALVAKLGRPGAVYDPAL